MAKISRREVVETMAAGGAGLLLANLAGAETISANQTISPNQGGDNWMIEGQSPSGTQAARAFRGQHQPKPLPFDPAKVKGLSEKLIRSHWENNYSGAVKALNVVEQRLDAMLKEKDIPDYLYGDLKREELVRTGSVVLHEHYFANLGGDGKPSGKALELLKQWFGSFEQWEAEFKKTANALSGGSGWVILAYNLHNGEVHNYWAWDHMHNAPMARPLLVLDMYEHSYQMDYGAAAAKYVETFVQIVNWEEVDRRAEAALKASLA